MLRRLSLRYSRVLSPNRLQRSRHNDFFGNLHHLPTLSFIHIFNGGRHPCHLGRQNEDADDLPDTQPQQQVTIALFVILDPFGRQKAKQQEHQIIHHGAGKMHRTRENGGLPGGKLSG